MKKRLILVVVAALALTGCGSITTGEETDASNIRYVEVTTPGGTVPCLVYTGYRKGGLDCNWEAAH